MSPCKDKMSDPRTKIIASPYGVHPNFPMSGTLLLNPKVFKSFVDMFVVRCTDKDVSIMNSEFRHLAELFSTWSYGCIAFSIGTIPLRKLKKLPGEVISENYNLEYGTGSLEIPIWATQSSEHALIVYDLTATGETLSATNKLLERVGAEVVECACMMELPQLQGRKKLNGKPVYKLTEYC